MRTLVSRRFVLLATVVMSACSAPTSGGGGGGAATGSDRAIWAVPTSPSVGHNASFAAVAADGSGNSYGVGYITGKSVYNFGSGESLEGSSTDHNALIVKYDAAGNAKWARTTASGTNRSEFKGVVTDADGNVYAVGETYGSTHDFGNGKSVTAAGSTNPVLVKYSPDGDALLAKTRSSGSATAGFTSVTIDGSGNLYAAGYAYAGSHDFGNGATLATTVAQGVLVVRYDTSGAAQWARGTVSGTAESFFAGIAVDGTGSVYAAGYQQGTGSHSFSIDATAQGASSSFNPLVVKYTAAGAAEWARSAAGGSRSVFHGIAGSSAGAYVVGELWSTGTADFGNSQTVAGTSPSINVLLVKYDASGAAVWARTQTSGQGFSVFKSVAADSAGKVYAVGTTYSNQDKSIGFGNSVVAKGTNGTADNPLLTKYDNSGTPQWTQTTQSGNGYARFAGAASSGSFVFVTGEMSGTLALNSSVTVLDGTHNLGTIAVKYNAD